MIPPPLMLIFHTSLFWTIQDDDKSVKICRRSHVYVQSLALGLSIVSEDWLIQSAKTDCWAKIDEYEIYADERTYNSRQILAATGICRRSRLLYRSETVPFFGYTFYIPQNNQKEINIARHITANLVEIWGGEILWTKEEVGTAIRTEKKCVCLVASSAPCVSSLYDTCMPFGYRIVEHLKSVGGSEKADVIDYSWIEDSVASCRLQPMVDYIRGEIVKVDQTKSIN